MASDLLERIHKDDGEAAQVMREHDELHQRDARPTNRSLTSEVSSRRDAEAFAIARSQYVETINLEVMSQGYAPTMKTRI
jgi:hypothetical protein